MIANEYISKDTIIKKIAKEQDKAATGIEDVTYYRAIKIIKEEPAADVQEKKYCKMIPLGSDCRGYTDVFICTNCHQHVHLGFVRKEYSGSFCLECGAEVKDGDINGCFSVKG